jgi:hypothetical protein
MKRRWAKKNIRSRLPHKSRTVELIKVSRLGEPKRRRYTPTSCAHTIPPAYLQTSDGVEGKCGKKKRTIVTRRVPEKSFRSGLYVWTVTSAQFTFALFLFRFHIIILRGGDEEPGGRRWGLHVHIDRQRVRISLSLCVCVWDCVLKLTGYSGVAFQSTTHSARSTVATILLLGFSLLLLLLLGSSHPFAPDSTKFCPRRYTQTHKFSGGSGGREE